MIAFRNCAVSCCTLKDLVAQGIWLTVPNAPVLTWVKLVDADEIGDGNVSLGSVLRFAMGARVRRYSSPTKGTPDAASLGWGLLSESYDPDVINVYRKAGGSDAIRIADLVERTALCDEIVLVPGDVVEIRMHDRYASALAGEYWSTNHHHMFETLERYEHFEVTLSVGNAEPRALSVAVNPKLKYGGRNSRGEFKVVFCPSAGHRDASRLVTLLKGYSAPVYDRENVLVTRVGVTERLRRDLTGEDANRWHVFPGDKIHIETRDIADPNIRERLGQGIWLRRGEFIGEALTKVDGYDVTYRLEDVLLSAYTSGTDFVLPKPDLRKLVLVTTDGVRRELDAHAENPEIPWGSIIDVAREEGDELWAQLTVPESWSLERSFVGPNNVGEDSLVGGGGKVLLVLASFVGNDNEYTWYSRVEVRGDKPPYLVRSFRAWDVLNSLLSRTVAKLRIGGVGVDSEEGRRQVWLPDGEELSWLRQ